VSQSSCEGPDHTPSWDEFSQDGAADGLPPGPVLAGAAVADLGRDLAQFLAYYRSLPEGSPPVYTIAFGEADLGPLAEMADVTGGTAFDAVGQAVSALSTIFDQIRGSQ
jgi:hypothetical protein